MHSIEIDVEFYLPPKVIEDSLLFSKVEVLAYTALLWGNLDGSLANQELVEIYHHCL